MYNSYRLFYYTHLTSTYQMIEICDVGSACKRKVVYARGR